MKRTCKAKTMSKHQRAERRERNILLRTNAVFLSLRLTSFFPLPWSSRTSPARCHWSKQRPILAHLALHLPLLHPRLLARISPRKSSIFVSSGMCTIYQGRTRGWSGWHARWIAQSAKKKELDECIRSYTPWWAINGRRQKTIPCLRLQSFSCSRCGDKRLVAWVRRAPHNRLLSAFADSPGRCRCIVTSRMCHGVFESPCVYLGPQVS